MERKRPQTPWFDRLITHCSIPSLHFSLGLFRSVLSHSVFALPAGLEGLFPSVLSKVKKKDFTPIMRTISHPLDLSPLSFYLKPYLLQPNHLK